MLRTCPGEAKVHAIPATPSAHLSRAALLVLLLYFLMAGVAKPLVRPHEYSDFVTFYNASRAFAEGVSPYDDTVLQAEVPREFSGWVGRYLYPPPFAAVYVRPLLHLPFPVARATWVFLESMAYLLAGILLTRAILGSTSLHAVTATACLMLPFAPFHFDLKLGSVSGLLLLLCSLFFLARSRGKETVAAIALAAAIVLKLTPALVLLVLILRGELRLAGRTILAGLLLGLLCLPWTGWTVYGEYISQVLPRLATDNYSWFSNQSLDALFWRLFVPNPDTTPWLASPFLHTALTATLSGILLVLLVRVARGERRREPGRDVAPALALLCASILARVTWEYMIVLALPSFLAALHAIQRGELRSRSVLALAVAFALCALPIPYAEEPLRSGGGLLLMSPRLYGMLLAFVVIAWECSRRKRRLDGQAQVNVGEPSAS